jgi:hypothetical protein
MSDLMCGECRAGDHKACYGGAWDNDYSEPAPCRCWAYNHRPFGVRVDVAPGPDDDIDIGEAEARANAYEAQFGWTREVD